MSNILPFSRRSSELDVFLIIGWKSLENWWHSIIFQSSTLCSWPDDKATFMKVVTTNEAMFCWLPLFSANCMNPLFQQVWVLMWKAMERIFKLLSQFWADLLEFKSWESFILILGRILCYILVVFEQDIAFGAYLTLQAESREDVDVF